MSCTCGHDENRHRDGISRCDGDCWDSDYGRYRCMCPVYDPIHPAPATVTHKLVIDDTRREITVQTRVDPL